MLDAEFYTGCRYDFDKRVEKVSPEKIEGVLEPQWHNEVLRIGVEFAGTWGAGKEALQEQELATG